VDIDEYSWRRNDMENGTKKLKNITLASLMAFSMILSAILLMPALIGEEIQEETKLWGRVLDSETTKPLDEAIITITNLQTGEVITLTQDKGRFELDDTMGYFTIQASKEGYFDIGSGHDEVLVLRGDVIYLILELEEVEKKRTVSGNVGFLNATLNVTGITNATVDLFCTGGDFKGCEDSTLTDNGSFEFEVYEGTYLLIVKNEGNLTMTQQVIVEQEDMVVNFTMTDGVSEFEIFGYVSDSYNADSIDGLEIVIYDVMNDRKMNASFEGTDYFLLSLYPSTFDLLVDAEGYKPYLKEGIELNGSDDVNPLYIDLDKDDDELSEVSYSFNVNLSKVEVLTDRSLNSDSFVTGFEEGAGNIKMKLDAKFGDNNGMVNNSEVNDFRDWMENIGPYYLYTDKCFTVNETAFGPEEIMNYSVVLYNFNGSVWNETGMRMKTTMIYEIEEEVVSENDVYSVWFGDLEDDYTVKFKEQYEIITEENDDWSFVKVDDEKVPHEAVIYNETTVTLALKEAPETNLTAIVDGVNHYPGDDIYVGSATDGTVAKVDFENITFDASGSVDLVGQIVNYTWDLGDGEKAYGEQIAHNYSVAQGNTETFEVTLLLTDSAGETNSDFENNKLLITVDATAPSVASTATLIETLQNNWTQYNKIEFNASTFEDDVELPDAAGNYIWEFEDGTENFGKTTEHVFNEAGETEVSLTVKDLIGNIKKVTLSLNILDTEEPVVEILGNLSVKAKETLSLNASICYDNLDDFEDLVFMWDFNDTEVNVRTNRTAIYVEPVYDVPGTYVVVLNVTDKAGNIGVATKTISVTAADLIIASMDISDTKPSKDEEVEVNVLISNKGTVAAEGFTVALYVDGKEVTSNYITFLDSGAKHAVNFTWKALAEEHEVSVKVDSDDVIIEEDEGNNEEMILVEGSESSSYTAIIVVVLLIIVAIVVFLVVKKKRDL